MTAMRSPLGGKGFEKSRSRPATPLTTQPMRAPPRISSTQVLQARHRRIASPRRSFSTHCGSAIKLRPSATKSALPLATVCATNDKHLVLPIVTKHYGGVVGHRVDDRPLGTVRMSGWTHSMSTPHS